MPRHIWQDKLDLLNAAKPHFGGGTSSTPFVPPQFEPLITSSVGNMVNQQGFNPISQYNASNPMGVQGLTEGQQYGMGMTAGAGMQSPLNSLALQAAQRAAGMAGQGPTTGMYDPSGEMGLQDWAQLMNPYFAQGGEIGNTQNPSDAAQIAAQGSNVAPQTPPQTNFSGGPPNMSLPPSGTPGGGQGGGYPGGQPGGGGYPGSTAPRNISGGQFYQDPSGNWRMANPSGAGNIQGTNVHGQGALNSQGALQQYYFAPSQGQATSPNQQLGAGTMSARPTDPQQAAIWDHLMALHPGATVGTQQSQAPQLMSMQQAMSDPRAANYMQHLQNAGAEQAALSQHQGWAAAAQRAAAAQAANPTPHAYRPPAPAAAAQPNGTATVKAMA